MGRSPIRKTVALYVDSSVVVRATLEQGLSADLEKRLHSAQQWLTSRLSTIETMRALQRAQNMGRIDEAAALRLLDEVRGFFAATYILEMTPRICDLAAQLAPRSSLRTLDAIHLASFLFLKQTNPKLEMLTCDHRLAEVTAGI